jgi:hypothetical protein
VPVDRIDPTRALARCCGMAASLRLMITKAESRFAVRVRLETAPAGFGDRVNRMPAWLDDNCGADGWETMPAGMRGVINDAIAVYFRDAALAAAFAAQWCAPVGAGVTEGCLRLRDDEPAQRVAARLHKTS